MRWRIKILFGFYCPLLSDLRCCLFYKMLHGEVGAAPFHMFPYATKRHQLFVQSSQQQLLSGMLHFSFLMWKLPQPSTCIVVESPTVQSHITSTRERAASIIEQLSKKKEALNIDKFDRHFPICSAILLCSHYNVWDRSTSAPTTTNLSHRDALKIDNRSVWTTCVSTQEKHLTAVAIDCDTRTEIKKTDLLQCNIHCNGKYLQKWGRGEPEWTETFKTSFIKSK